jgi:acyl-CoA reductase-like NAD-dependent aldehyde dehydrogenase
MDHFGLFIDGEECEGATGERMPVIYPYTGEPFATVSVAAPADVERAVASADAAYHQHLPTSAGGCSCAPRR